MRLPRIFRLWGCGRRDVEAAAQRVEANAAALGRALEEQQGGFAAAIQILSERL